MDSGPACTAGLFSFVPGRYNSDTAPLFRRRGVVCRSKVRIVHFSAGEVKLLSRKGVRRVGPPHDLLARNLAMQAFKPFGRVHRLSKERA